jgi:hypothetical protein
LKKALRILGGFGLILVGFVLALPFVPGPGIPLMILGLVILGDHFPWARRIVDWGKSKLEGRMGKSTPKSDPNGVNG